MRYLLAVGSNVHPRVNIRWLLFQMQSQLNALKVGRFFHSKPSGMKSKHGFWNGALLVESELGMLDFKKCLCRWEMESGRDRAHANCSLRDRTLDIDIIWSEQGGWLENIETIMQVAYLQAPLSSLIFLPPFRKACLKPIYFSFQGKLLGARPVRLK